MSRVFGAVGPNFLRYAGDIGTPPAGGGYLIWYKEDAPNSAENFGQVWRHQRNVDQADFLQLLQSTDGNARTYLQFPQENSPRLYTTTPGGGNWLAMVIERRNDNQYIVHYTGGQTTLSAFVAPFDADDNPRLTIGADDAGANNTSNIKVAAFATFDVLDETIANALLAGADPMLYTGPNNVYFPMGDDSLLDRVSGSKVLSITGTVTSDDQDNPPVDNLILAPDAPKVTEVNGGQPVFPGQTAVDVVGERLDEVTGTWTYGGVPQSVTVNSATSATWNLVEATGLPYTTGGAGIARTGHVLLPVAS